MTIQDFPYSHSSAEHMELRQFLIDTYAAYGRLYNWSAARWEDWKYGGNSVRRRDDPAFFTRNVRVWRTGAGAVAGFVVSEYGGAIFLQTHPAHAGLEPDMLRWIEEEWGPERAEIQIEVYADDAPRAALLAARGYRDAGETGNMREYDPSTPLPDCPLPSGFHIATLAESYDPPAHVEAVRSAFWGNPAATLDWFANKNRAPGYSLEWDLAVVAPDGRHAAFALAWPVAAASMAEIDPVGTQPDFQRMGLGKAVLTELFRRLAAAGIRRAYIGSAGEPYHSNRLYERLRPLHTWPVRNWVLRRAAAAEAGLEAAGQAGGA